MRTCRLGLLFILMFAAAFICEAQVSGKGISSLPEKVKPAFIAKFPKSSELIWSASENTIWASFKDGNDYFDAYFKDSGEWLKTEHVIEEKLLPKAVLDSLKSGEFKTWQTGSVYKVELPGNDSIFKLFVYSPDWYEMELNFDKNGKRLL